jgi:hypothetical protein
MSAVENTGTENLDHGSYAILDKISDEIISVVAISPSQIYNLPLMYYLEISFCLILSILVVFPVLIYFSKNIKALTHPIMFPYKHVLITGCGTGLGKALVQEMYLKGAYITMVGRDSEKL